MDGGVSGATAAFARVRIDPLLRADAGRRFSGPGERDRPGPDQAEARVIFVNY